MSNLALVPEISGRPITSPDAASSDDALVVMWLRGKSPRTQRAYHRTISRLRAFTAKRFAEMGLRDLQDYVSTLEGKATSVGTTIAAIKSFFSFANRLGALPFNVGGMLKLEKARETLPDRIMSEDDVEAMLSAATGRDALFVRFLYATALRVSEAVSVRWGDFAKVDRGDAIVTVLGKGSRTRSVRFDAGTWDALKRFRGDAPPDARTWTFGTGYARKRIGIIRQRAKLEKKATPHWFRHAHASHAVQNGEGLDVIQRTLGHASISTTGIYLKARPRECSARKLAILQRPA
jgi:integrase/recombinase XerD